MEISQDSLVRSDLCGPGPAPTTPHLIIDIIYLASAYLCDKNLVELSCTCREVRDILRYKVAEREARCLDYEWCFRQCSPSGLSHAIKGGQPLYIIDSIVRGYASINGTIIEGWVTPTEDTPTHLAASLNRTDVVELLLDNGVPVHLRQSGHRGGCCPFPHIHNTERFYDMDCPGKTILEVAKKAGSDDVVALLLKRGADESPIDLYKKRLESSSR